MKKIDIIFLLFYIAIGHLRVKNDEYSILVDLLTTCDRNMLLKKLSDIRSEYASKLIFFGTIGAILSVVFFRYLFIETKGGNKGNAEWDEPIRK